MKIKNSHDLAVKILTNKKFDSRGKLKIDYGKLLYLLSSHLMIPSFYINLKIHKKLKYFQEDFIEYIKQIYLLNLERNQVLIEEVKYINSILKKELLKKFVFIKGSALIFDQIYNDLGERMIGDVDILVDDNHIKKTIRILKKNGYYSKNQENVFEFRHEPRLINKKKIFAIEVHSKLLDKMNKLISKKEIFQNPKIIDEIFIPEKKILLLNNIYGHQINDKGYISLNHNLRNMYDSFMIIKSEPKLLEKLEKNKYIISYIELLNIFGFLNTSNKIEVINQFRMNLKYNNKTYRKFENFIINLIIRLQKLPVQLKGLIINKDYRSFVLKKYFKKEFE